MPVEVSTTQEFVQRDCGVSHRDVAPSGAGEPSIRVIPSALANAVYDATGVRMRKAPLSPERVKAALGAT